MLKRKYKYVYVNTENKFIIFYLQGAQDSEISGFLRYLGLSWDFFSVRGYLRNLGISWNFFIKACQVFNLIILISYLLDNSLGQGIKSSQVRH